VSDTTVVTVVGEIEVTVTVVIPEPGSAKRPAAWVIARCLPGYWWWTCPSAAELRRLVDAALPEGYRRDGARVPRESHPSGWRFLYCLKAAS